MLQHQTDRTVIVLQLEILFERQTGLKNVFQQHISLEFYVHLIFCSDSFGIGG